MNLTKGLALVLVFELFFALGMFLEVPQKTQFVTKEKPVYVTQVREVNRTVEIPVPIVNISEMTATVYAVGIHEKTGGGELITINVSLRNGTGETFVDISGSAFESDFQTSLKDARAYAERFSNRSTKNYDLVVRVASSAKVIGGSSGSAAITVALISLLENFTLRNDTVLSGVLQSDGSGTVAEVSGLETKIGVAEGLGLKRFLVPASQYASSLAQAKSIQVIAVRSIDDAVREMRA